MNTLTTTLTTGWKFILADEEEAWYAGYNDSAWESVMIPHDWSVRAPFSQEYSSGTGYVRGGTGWYRCHVNIPAQYIGKHIYITFDGVYKNSLVFVNSSCMGKRPSGYASFSYDISQIAKAGENIISVRVSHNDIADSRWFTGSGILRKVTLTVEENVAPVEYGIVFGTDTVEFDTQAGEDQSSTSQIACNARIHLKSTLHNYSSQDRSIIVNHNLYDHNDKAVLRLSNNVIIPAGLDVNYTLEDDLSDPHLWSIDDPYLYRLETTIADGETNRIPSYTVDTTYVGIRSIRFDPDHGFFINDQNLKIKGVCVHDDAGSLGSAVTRAVWERRLRTLKKCGCNAIRCSHNPHMTELYDLCDRLGFVVMDEAFDEWENAKNKWAKGHNVYPPKHQGYFEDFHEWHEKDLRTMIRRSVNHPSIILWSVGNEIDYPNDPYVHPSFAQMTGNNDSNKPEAERLYDTKKPNMERLAVIAKELTAIVRDEDPTRPATLAAAFPELSADIGFIDSLDVVGYNYKEHLYDKDHKAYPEKTFLGSENGHSIEAWRAVTDNDYICGQFLWTGIDYLGETRGWPSHGAEAGLLATTGFRKAEFYRRQSMWDDAPFLHIETFRHGEDNEWSNRSRSWDYKNGELVDVLVYATLDADTSVKLTINDVKAGIENTRTEDGVFRFTVRFEKGTLRASALIDGREITDEIISCDDENSLDLSMYDSIFDTSQQKQAIGYLHQVKIRLLDGSGHIKSCDRLRCSDSSWDDDHQNAQQVRVRISVAGDGVLDSLDNGNLSDLTPYYESSRTTYNGKLMAYIRRTGPGNILVTAVIDGEDTQSKLIL